MLQNIGKNYDVKRVVFKRKAGSKIADNINSGVRIKIQRTFIKFKYNFFEIRLPGAYIQHGFFF